jgi:hypothetical protein
VSIPIIGSTDPEPMVEVTRSFSYKLNLARFNPQLQYESRDFFCSEKSQCKASDAEATSQKLYDFCKREVLAAVRESIYEIMEAQGKKVRNVV